MTCDKCNGEGVLPISDCCDAEIINNHICEECYNECGRRQCDECDGYGTIDAIKTEGDLCHEETNSSRSK